MPTYTGKVGAPKGGRTHWLDDCLPRQFKQVYKLIGWNYSFHNYLYERQTGERNRRDLFAIVRTSPKCFRVTYWDLTDGTCDYQSFKTFRLAISFMLDKWFEKNERENLFARQQQDAVNARAEKEQAKLNKVITAKAEHK